MVSFLSEHPRACGENAAAGLGFRGGCGTSPRMRGKPRGIGDQGKLRRNIPAHAGKTVERQPIIILGQEHPRACGENGWWLRCAPPGGGTSPRMRGKPIFSTFSTISGRNIPAHAGKTPHPPQDS